MLKSVTGLFVLQAAITPLHTQSFKLLLRSKSARLHSVRTVMSNFPFPSVIIAWSSLHSFSCWHSNMYLYMYSLSLMLFYWKGVTLTPYVYFSNINHNNLFINAENRRPNMDTKISTCLILWSLFCRLVSNSHNDRINMLQLYFTVYKSVIKKTKQLFCIFPIIVCQARSSGSDPCRRSCWHQWHGPGREDWTWDPVQTLCGRGASGL